MNGQEPNQNLNNINSEESQNLSAAPSQTPINSLAKAEGIAGPTAPEMASAPAESPVAPAPEMSDSSAVMPQVSPALETIQPSTPVSIDPASVMPQAPIAPVVPDASDAMQPTAPAPVDSSSVMPQLSTAPEMATTTSTSPSALETPVMPQVSTAPVAPALDSGQAPIVNQNTIGQVSMASPAAATNASASEKPAKKGIAIDKNVIIIVVGLVIIIAVLLIAWANGLIFAS